MAYKPPVLTYDVHPSVAYARTIIDNLPEKTGKSIKQWVQVLKRKKIEDEKAQKAWLKEEHGLGATTAALIVSHLAGRGEADVDPGAYLEKAAEHVEAMYMGPKAKLRPIHDKLYAVAHRLGDDVRISPCKTIVPIYRKHVFAEIKPATKTRVDLGLALKGSSRKPPKLFLATGGGDKGDRITHRVPIGTVEEIDEIVKRWMQIAYDLDR